MRTQTLLIGLGLTALLALGSVSPTRADLVFDVTLDTSALIGGSYFVDFQLNDGDGVQNNTVSLSNFTFGGGSAGGSPVLLGGASGSLGSGATIIDSDFLNELTEGFTPGSTLGFHVDLTTNLAPGANTPDQFSFALLDDQGNEVPTTSANGSFVSVNIDSSSPTVEAFGSDPAAGGPTIPMPEVVVPEPGSVAFLLVGGMTGAALLVRRRKNR